MYTGTHDNVTTEGWRATASPEDVPLRLPVSALHPQRPDRSHDRGLPFLRVGHGDHPAGGLAAPRCSEARINTPSTQGANWQWRLTTPLTSLLADHIADLTVLYDRAPAAE